MPHYRIPRRAPGADNNFPGINWRRGLFRLWMLISMAWVMGWIVYLIMFGIGGGFRDTSYFLKLPVLLFGPPIALFVFGILARWAFQGFAPDNKQTERQ